MKYLLIILFSIAILTSCEEEKTTKGEIFATTPNAVGNITFTPKGDLVYSLHPFFKPENRVMIMDAKTKTERPFPNKKWNTPRDTDNQYLSNVLGIRNDENGIVWMLDMGQRNPITPKIVGWNVEKNSLEKIYYLDSTVIKPSSQPNDMVIDTKHHAIIIADEGIGNGGNGSQAAFIIVDMKSGKTRRILEGTRTTLPENKPITVNGKNLSVNGKNLLVGNDGITADANFEWIYYGPLNGTKLYRVKTVDLLNESLSEADIDKTIETYSEKPNNGGLSIDKDGNIYLTGLETNSIELVSAKDRSLKTVFSDKKLEWPDGVSYNQTDGYMYVSAAQVHLGAVFNDGIDKSTDEFYIFRFKPLAEGIPFR